jgi:Protein of unknown function (DUF2970)
MSTPPSRNFGAAIIAVLCAFIGIRKRGASLADQGIKPLHIIIAALMCAGIFVSTLIFIVRLVIANAK